LKKRKECTVCLIYIKEEDKERCPWMREVRVALSFKRGTYEGK
jgi:hypothetical protein